MSTPDIASLVANARADISDADRCVSLHITPATGMLHRRLREVTDALVALSTPPADDVRVVSADVVLAALAHVYDGLADRASLPAVRMSNAKLRLRRLTDQIDQQAFEVRPRGTVTETEAQALAWSAGYEAGAEDQANVEGHRYTPDNTSWMVVSPNPHRGAGMRS